MTDLPDEARAMLSAIAANHADDTPRLIFADYLDERGTPEAAARAEFVRCQIELARMGDDGMAIAHNVYGKCVCRLCSLRDRELVFMSPGPPTVGLPRGWGWTTSPSRMTGNGQPVGLMHRGFLSRIRCDWNSCSQHLDSILADPWVPGLDEVELTTEPRANAGVLTWNEPSLHRAVWIAGQHTSLGQLPGFKRTWLHLSPAQLERRDDFARSMLEFRWPKEKVRSWKLPPEPMEPMEPARCEVCDWPLATRREDGCVPGNCAYRPDEDSEEGRRIRRRREELGRTR